MDIKALRESMNWSQLQLARYLGVNQATVSRIEKGQKPSGPSTRMLERLQEHGAETGAAA